MEKVVVDAHLHVWSNNETLYPKQKQDCFIGGEKIDGSVELLLKMQAKGEVDKAVLVQSGNYGYDHSYLFDCCRRYPERFASVGLLDPLSEHASQLLTRMVREKGLGGVRLRPLITENDWSWLTDKSTYSLWEAAAELSVPINFLILPKQIPALKEMVNRFPQVNVIIDHLGRQYPEEAPGYSSAKSLIELAYYPNTYVKISALSAVSSRGYPYNDTKDLVMRIYEAFGSQRLMWGSDFPYVQLKEGYVKSRAIVDNYTFMSDDDRSWLLGRTASSLYNFETEE